MTADSQGVAIERRTRLFSAADITAAIKSGLIGGAAMGIVAMVISGFIQEGIDFWTPVKHVSGWFYGASLTPTGFETGPVLIGGATHMILSAFYGVIFVVLYRRVFRLPLQLGLPFLVGGVYGVMLWGAAKLYLPALNTLMAEADKPAFILGHLTYGAVLGLAYEQLHPKLPRRNQTEDGLTVGQTEAREVPGPTEE